MYLSAFQSPLKLHILAFSLFLLASGNLFVQAEGLTVELTNGFNSDQSLITSQSAHNREAVVETSALSASVDWVNSDRQAVKKVMILESI